ncbi:MAG: hypothetical protein IKH34_08070 [Oscillospiraceae bacterium]|nr:hypothetical protein [Oscillospiraceae bacterium]
MTNLEKRKQEEERLQKQNPALRNKTEMARFQEQKEKKNMRASAVVLVLALALVMGGMTLGMKDEEPWLRSGIPMGYWLACLFALALCLGIIFALRWFVRQRSEREENGETLLTEETLLRDGWRIPLRTAAAYALLPLLLTLWLHRNRLPPPAAAMALPFIVPLLILLVALTQALPIGAALDSARLARAIRRGDYRITEELLCDKEHIVERGGTDEKDSHEYYLFYRSRSGGGVKRERVGERLYDGAKIGQSYYRFCRGDRVLKSLPGKSCRLDAELGAHLEKGRTQREGPLSEESEEIRQQVDQLRVGQAPEKDLEPVPPDMNPEKVKKMQEAAAPWLRKYDVARGCIAGGVLMDLCLIGVNLVLRHHDPRATMMSSPTLLMCCGAAMLIAITEIALLMKSIRYLEQAEKAFPYENEEYQRRIAKSGRTILLDIAGFFLFFGVIFTTIF